VQNELEKLDAIRERVDVGIEEARWALQEAGGDVVTAIAMLEERKSKDVLAVALEFADDVQRLVKAGAAKKIRIKFGGKVIKEVPVALTAAAALVLGVAAVLITKSSIEIVREEARSEG
jgi:hypothetical protein